jgi:hypothetical protein
VNDDRGLPSFRAAFSGDRQLTSNSFPLLLATPVAVLVCLFVAVLLTEQPVASYIDGPSVNPQQLRFLSELFRISFLLICHDGLHPLDPADRKWIDTICQNSLGQPTNARDIGAQRDLDLNVCEFELFERQSSELRLFLGARVKEEFNSFNDHHGPCSPPTRWTWHSN